MKQENAASTLSLFKLFLVVGIKQQRVGVCVGERRLRANSNQANSLVKDFFAQSIKAQCNNMLLKFKHIKAKKSTQYLKNASSLCAECYYRT